MSTKKIKFNIIVRSSSFEFKFTVLPVPGYSHGNETLFIRISNPMEKRAFFERRNRLSTAVVVDKGPSLLTHFPSASTDLSTRLGSVYFSLSPAVYPGHVCSLEILHFTRGREGMDTIIIKLFGFDINCCKKFLNSSLFKVL